MVALDFDGLGPAYDVAQRVAAIAGMFKIGSQLFTAEGPPAIRKLARLGPGIFLDLKFHDIPSTVAGAVSAAADLPGIRLLDVHALGGLEMMRAAAGALGSGGKVQGGRPKLLGITVLTSLNDAALREVGMAATPGTSAVKLARLAQRAGLNGAVASAHEAHAIRRACGKRFIIVVPGVRPHRPGPAAKVDDQARVATPAEAILAGADYIVVGRPITAARDPRAAGVAILEEIFQARRARN